MHLLTCRVSKTFRLPLQTRGLFAVPDVESRVSLRFSSCASNVFIPDRTRLSHLTLVSACTTSASDIVEYLPVAPYMGTTLLFVR